MPALAPGTLTNIITRSEHRHVFVLFDVLLLVVTALCVPHLVRPFFAAAYSQALDKAYLLKAYWPKEPESESYHSRRLREHRKRLTIRSDIQICSMNINADMYRPSRLGSGRSPRGTGEV